MIFKKATIQDVPTIASTMQTIYTQLDNKDLYIIDDEEFIYETLHHHKGFTIMAMDENILAGYFIIRFPNPDEQEHLGDFLGFTQQQKEQCVYFDSAAVLPEYRHQGLQSRMLQECEKHLAHTSYHHALATVSPDNPASLHSLLKNNFQIITTTKLYNGRSRHVLYKELKNES